MARYKIPGTPTMRRMPTYLQKLYQMRLDGRIYASCTDLANYIGVDSIVTRKDMAMTGLAGHRRYGYKIDELVQAILSFIGLDEPVSATLVGAGALGSALLGYHEFSSYNFRIESVFDSDPGKIGHLIHGCQVHDIGDIRMRLGDHLPKIGVICVPSPVAQATAELLISLGIRYLWNFANVCLKVPDGVIVQREVIAGGLAVLTSKIRHFEQGETVAKGE